MKALFVVGLVLLILGIGSLFVPIPKKDRAGVEIGGVSLGVETRTRETVSPIISAALVIAGAGMMIAGRGKAR
jgi:hypothetical protein